MDLPTFVRQVGSFTTRNHSEKIKFFGWFLHSYRGQERFGGADIKQCYEASHLVPPSNIYRSLEALGEKLPPDLLKDSKGYRLSQAVREQLDHELGRAEVLVAVERMLSELPGRIADEGERLFLAETLTCYRNGAFRAAIVMVWNLAYDHLTRWVLADPGRLTAFNAGIAKRNAKKAHIIISTREDFEELKEDETIDIASNLPAITSGMKKLLKEKLGRRNTFAHPSMLKVERAQVDDMITDLVNNVVLSLKL